MTDKSKTAGAVPIQLLSASENERWGIAINGYRLPYYEIGKSEAEAICKFINRDIKSHFVSRKTAEKMAEALRDLCSDTECGDGFQLSEYIGLPPMEGDHNCHEFELWRKGKEALEAFDKER